MIETEREVLLKFYLDAVVPLIYHAQQCGAHTVGQNIDVAGSRSQSDRLYLSRGRAQSLRTFEINSDYQLVLAIR